MTCTSCTDEVGEKVPSFQKVKHSAVSTGQTRAVFCYALPMGVFAYGVDRIHFKITSLVKPKCSVADSLLCGAALVMTTSFLSRLLDKL